MNFILERSFFVVILLQVYADTFRMMSIQPRLVPVDCQRVRQALADIQAAGHVDEKVSRLLCSHIHMYYYRYAGGVSKFTVSYVLLPERRALVDIQAAGYLD